MPVKLKTMVDVFLEEQEGELPPTRKTLQRVPEGKNDWKPHPKSMPLGYLVLPRSLMNHWAHHRGQLTVYLRLNEAPVPSIYGPSADDKSFG